MQNRAGNKTGRDAKGAVWINEEWITHRIEHLGNIRLKEIRKRKLSSMICGK